MGKGGNNLLVFIGLGTALQYTGLADPDTAVTAETALKAGAYTLGISLFTRDAVGHTGLSRSRTTRSWTTSIQGRNWDLPANNPGICIGIWNLWVRIHSARSTEPISGS